MYVSITLGCCLHLGQRVHWCFFFALDKICDIFFVTQGFSSTGKWGQRVCWEFCLTKMWHHLLVKDVLQHYSWVKECIDSFSELLTRYVTPFLGDGERFILVTLGSKSVLTAFLCSWQETWHHPMFQPTVTWGLNDRKQRERKNSTNIQQKLSWEARYWLFIMMTI